MLAAIFKLHYKIISIYIHLVFILVLFMLSIDKSIKIHDSIKLTLLPEAMALHLFKEC